MTIEILRPGLLSTIQDAGRTGYRAIGVGVSGVMDDMAFRIANLMAGNSEELAVIEVTLGGIELRFTEETTFAITGADAGFTLDGEPLPVWWCATARAGQVLRAASPRTGVRSYIAFAGGIDVPVVLGARATDLKAGFGGYEGRCLAAGDRLAVSGSATYRKPFGLSAVRFGLDPASACDENGATVLRMIPAAEWGDYASDTQALFLSTAWRIDPASNRVGVRLNGPELHPVQARELLSHGILPGTVQLPPSGTPIVQMLDANTMGGYPKPGVVIGPDLRRLAQTRLGGLVRFEAISHEEALAVSKINRSTLERIGALVEMARGVVRGEKP